MKETDRKKLGDSLREMENEKERKELRGKRIGDTLRKTEKERESAWEDKIERNR